MIHETRAPTLSAGTLVAVLFLAALGAGCSSPSPAPEEGSEPEAVDGRDFATRLEERLHRWEALGRFSGAVAVGAGGELLYAGGFGEADRERGTPNRPETPFALASLTKQLAAAAVLKLEAEGRLAVEDTVAEHLPDYPGGERITLHQLLTHTAGIPSPGRLGDGLEAVAETAEPISTERLLAYFRDREPLFEPGSRYRYSNAGYQLLAAIIERVAGKPYEDYLEEDLLAPLGIESTGCRAPAERALGYHGFPGTEIVAPEQDPSWSLGDGCAYSTVLDLWRWDQALAGGEALPEAQRRKLFAPHVARPGGGHYGYGWFLSDVLERPAVHHGGSGLGVVVEMLRLPGEDLVVIVLANYLPTAGVSAPQAIAREAAALYLGLPAEPLPQPVGRVPDEVEAWAGRYGMESGSFLDLEVSDGSVWIAGPAFSVFDYGELEEPMVRKINGTRGARIIDRVLAGAVAELHPELCADLRDAMTVAELEADWAEVLGGRDEPLSVLHRASSRYPGESLAIETYELGSGGGDVVFLALDLTPAGELCGWYLMDYDEFAFRRDMILPRRTRLVALGPTRLLADGFNYRENDVVVELVVGEGGRREIVVEGRARHRGVLRPDAFAPSPAMAP